MTYRRFAIGFVTAIALFVLLNAAVWNLFTRGILTRQDGLVSGDLARIGYVTDLVHRRRNVTDLPRRHLESGDYRGQAVDLLTVGDSFSQGAAGGRNRYYQDFLATGLDWTVLNLQRYPGTANDIETIALLANSGFLQRAGIRYVLLEATQRRAVTRLSRPVDMDLRIDGETIGASYGFGDGSSGGFRFNLPGTGFINDGNFKFLLYTLLYRVHDCALLSATCRVSLRSARFSIGSGREMLFYRKDTGAIRHHTPENIAAMNDRLNALAARLKPIGVTLLFMPAVSKFDLYRDDFVDDSYPRDPFFDLLRRQQRDYLLVDTKAILSQGLEDGERDIFYVDDTHWGPAASRRIAAAIRSLVSG